MHTEPPIRRGSVQPVDVVFILVMTAVCIVTIGANLLVLATICFTRKLRSVSSALVVNMAVCDLGVGVMAMPLLVTGLFRGQWAYSQVACITTAVLTNALCIGSVCSVGVIALDRYLAITYCLRYSSWSTWKYAGGLVVCIWIVALLLGLSPFLSWGEVRVQLVSFTCAVDWTQQLSYGIVTTIVCYIFPFVLMGYSYCKIILVARKHARRIGNASAHGDGRGNVSATGAVAAGAMFSIRRLSMLSFADNMEVKSDLNSFFDNDFGSSGSMANAQSTINRSIRATMRLVALIAISALCWIPYVLVRMDAAVRRSGSAEYPYLVFTGYCLAVTHSTLNPFLYAIGSKDFRRASRKLFQCKNTPVTEKTVQQIEYISSYTNFLRNLRSPTLEAPENALLFQRRHLSTPDTSSTLTESRPSSAYSDISRRHFLEVPRTCYRESIVFVLPNSVVDRREEHPPESTEALIPSTENPDVTSTSELFTELRYMQPVNVGIREFVYDSKNSANITIRLDLV